jgi:hypothetical protein
VVVRVLLWSLIGDDAVTVEELRRQLEALPAPSTWLWNAAAERAGAIVWGDDVPDEVARARSVIGREPDVYEEFDAG